MMLMKRFLSVALAVIGLTLSAQAITIIPGPVLSTNAPLPDTTVNLTPSNGLYFTDTGNVTTADLLSLFGITVNEVYKQNVGGAEEPANASYTTAFQPSNSNPTGATVTYQGAPKPKITGASIYVLAKGGTTQGNYIWNITGWDGEDLIDISGLYSGGGSISHLSILTGDSTSVPDGGTTALLLGLGLFGTALVVRRLQPART
jgi:hypothetical protein